MKAIRVRSHFSRFGAFTDTNFILPVFPHSALHTSFSSHAFSKFLMPAMSPTMTEGGLATWKVQEGQSFSSGDVLLEIETDKATMDVEAQDDGVMAKIVVQAGEKNVSVGKMIAILAEEGDDLSKAESEVGPEASNKEALSESLPSSSSASFQELSTRQVSSSLAAEISSASPSASMLPNQSHHAKPDPPMFPSVLRMLNERKMSPHDAKSKIKGTGMRGMITKGDLLVFLGQAKTPTGTYKDEPAGISDLGGSPSGKLTKTIGQEATKVSGGGIVGELIVPTIKRSNVDLIPAYLLASLFVALGVLRSPGASTRSH